MRKTLLLRGFLNLIGLLLTGCQTSPSNPIAVDIGHSKAKPGAISASGKTEFEFNVNLGKKIAEALTAQHIPVCLIGELGDKVALRERTDIANSAKARFYLSVHHDSVQAHYLKSKQMEGIDRHYSDHAHGFSLFVSRKNPALTQSLKCASAIGNALIYHGFTPSSHHAEAIPGENKTWADQASGVYYYDNLVVLKTAAMPAVLLEAGVIVNPQEEKVLQNPNSQTKLTAAVLTGLRQCEVLKGE
jgi:N-acetylmuramoyl-L-alanine amidase